MGGEAVDRCIELLLVVLHGTVAGEGWLWERGTSMVAKGPHIYVWSGHTADPC